jgi:hypothetical protein
MPRAVTLWFIPYLIFYTLMAMEMSTFAWVGFVICFPLHCAVVFPKLGFCKKYKDIKNPDSSPVTKVDPDPEAPPVEAPA